MVEYSERLIEFVRYNYEAKYGTLDGFDMYFDLYLRMPSFKANENFHERFGVLNESNNPYGIDNECEFMDRVQKDNVFDYQSYLTPTGELIPQIHWIMRSVAQYYQMQVFDALKIDQHDPNIAINALGKGTPGRIIKMWSGNDPEDTTELLSARWNKEPALSVFPNDGSTTGGEKVTTPIVKEVDITAVCSHHFLPFSSLFEGAKAIITYIPKDRLIGISKLQRFANWCAKRGWLQEDLTYYIGTTIKRISGSEDVKVELIGLKHGCEAFRGASSKDGKLTTSYKSGIFADK